MTMDEPTGGCAFCDGLAAVNCPVCDLALCYKCWDAHKRVMCPQSKSSFGKKEYAEFHRDWQPQNGGWER